MTSIKSLPEAVRSSVRSGVIIFDLTRVVEELIFNSLDAGASKVSIFLGVGTCYVKVVDNGFGVTRDELLLMGERYATSKFDDLTDEHAASGNFGFRGEALASISDVSLLEIVSKANGKPNGYRKVMKGSNCLFLGIDNDRKDVGTTVVIRDLYYNQPVRRNYIQSSPKKVLESVKKCVLRIALMHSQVSFDVINIESDDMLLCTRPSSTLSLLTSAFGMEIATSLHELNMDDGNMKLFGYISGPSDNLIIKAFQYVYINSRFVYKGPVHKLLNQLAARFEYWDQAGVASGHQSRKRNRLQVHPAFILNICCPRSFYDLTFESSKTFVHFKDWTAVHSFIDKAIQTFWREDIFNGSASHIKEKEQMSSGHDNILSPDEVEDFLEEFPKNLTNGKKMCTVQNHQASLKLLGYPSNLLAFEDEFNCLSRAEHVVPIEFSNPNTKDLRDQELEMDFHCQNGSSFQLWDFPLTRSKPKASRKHENHMCISGKKKLSAEIFSLGNRVTTLERSQSSVENLTLPWENESSEVNFVFGNGSVPRALSCHNEGFGKNLEMSQVQVKPFLNSCSSSYSTERELCIDGKLDFQSEVCWAKEIDTGHYTPEIDEKKQSFDFYSRNLLQDHGSNTQTFPMDMTNSHLSSELDYLPRELVNPIPSYTEHVDKINGFPSNSLKDIASTGLNSEWLSVNLKPLSQLVPWDVQHCTDNGILGESCGFSDNHFVDTEENNRRLSFSTMSKSSSLENFTTSCKNSQLEHTRSSKFLQKNNLNNNFPPECSDLLIDETGWLGCDARHIDRSGIERYETQRNWISHQDVKIDHFKQRSRSSSAPPYYRRKKRISALKYPSTVTEDIGDMTHLHQSFGIGQGHLNPSVSKNLFLDMGMKNLQDIEEWKMNMHKDVKFVESTHIQDTDPVAAMPQFSGLVSEDFQESPNNWTKWRDGYPLTTTKNKVHNILDANNVLDISSGILHFTGDSLVPGSIDKNFLDEARVLLQLDKKFIPVVAGRILAVIDQHAADERIRLEELREKVLSGEAKTITFLDAEQELMLPEIGHQLLQNYAEMIKEWGWICNIHTHVPMSFKRNMNLLHRQPTVLTLIAVPCILGVNLSDTDLMEFLQQLADTDGSSTIPPSVLRILNSKACRGAIMFGDSLLPSECSLIVEELKQTSLCFQCAHGRPTTAPLVNLEVLHKQIAKISLLNGEDNLLLWHGLCHHEFSLERAMRRLRSS